MMKKKPALQTEHRDVTAEALAQAFAEHGAGLTEAQLSQTRAPLRHLHTAPEVFQPRDDSARSYQTESHIRTLTSVVTREAQLEPITVFAIAGTRYVVDGHCRLEAYKKAGKRPGDTVAVRHLRGTFHDALMASAAGNSRDKLPLTRAEKQEAAWRMVLHNHRHACYTVRKIAQTAGIAVGTVHGMQRTLWALLARGDELDTMLAWRLVPHISKGVEPGEWTDKDTDELRARFKKKLHKAFGKLRTTGQLEIALDALREAYPRMWEMMRQEVEDDSFEDEEFSPSAVDPAWQESNDF